MREKIWSAIIFFFIASVTFFYLLTESQNNYNQAMTTIGQNSTAREIIFSTEVENDEEIYKTLQQALIKFNGNVYCFDVDTSNNKKIYIKYARRSFGWSSPVSS